MAQEAAGSVSIEIGGNLAPFEAALAKARQMATAFEAEVSKKLSGTSATDAALSKISASIDQTNAFLAKLTGTGTTASAVMSKIAASTTDTTSALGKVAAASKAANAQLTDLVGSLRGYSQAQVDAFRSQQVGAEFNRTLTERVGLLNTATTSARDSALAFQVLGLTETEVALAAQGASAGLGRTGSASRLAAHDVRNLKFQLIDIAQSIPMAFQSPLYFMQNLGFQFAQIGQIFIGQGGLKAAISEFGSLVGSVLSPAVGVVAALGGTVLGGIAAYMLAVREDIKSVNEILAGHKALLDEVAASYPQITGELKKYQEAAANLPTSVIAADTQTQLENTQRTLATSLDHLKSDLREFASVPDVVGSAGAAAFGKLSDMVGNVPVEQLVKSLGDIRLDPALTPDAKHFADTLQGAANAALTLQDILDKGKGVKSISVDGQKAVHSLFEVSAGFKDVGATVAGADATIAKLFGTMNSGGGNAFGVTRSLGTQLSGQLQTTLGMFQTVDQAVQHSRQNQLAGIMELDTQFRSTTDDADKLIKALLSVGDKGNLQQFFGNTSQISDASSEIERATSTVVKLFDALNHGNTSVNAVRDGLEMVRQTLINDGFPTGQVDLFIQRLIQTKTQLDNDVAGAKQLHAAIQAIQNRTVTITVVTRQVGTGTQSTYDVPNQTGGTSGVGVTRYSSNGPAVSSTPIFDTSTNSWGYTQPKTYQDPRVLAQVAAMYPQRAAGGPISAGMPYWVGERGPELVTPSSAGTVIPHAQSMALSTGQIDVQDQDKVMAALTGTAANTLKTTQLLDDIKMRSASSGFGDGLSSGSGSSSGGTSDDPLYPAYLKALATAKSNAHNVSGIIGYGAQGLSATPQQIAHRAVYGFATGGVMGGDTEHVEFFKSPGEKVIIARPDQFADVRPGNANTTTAGADQRPIVQTFNVRIDAQGGNVSRESQAALRAQFAAIGRDMARSINGR